MTSTRDWNRSREMWVRVLEKQTGEGVEEWNRRIARQKPGNEKALRDWLASRGVTGHARQLLVFECFGYPDFLRASAEELIANQYKDRPHLRPIYEAIVGAASAFGEVAIQARKTYVSLVTPRRTFARIQPATRERVDLGLCIEGRKPGGRLKPLAHSRNDAVAGRPDDPRRSGRRGGTVPSRVLRPEQLTARSSISPPGHSPVASLV